MDILLHDARHILTMGLLLVLSGLFSGTETAIFSLNSADLNRLRRSPTAAHRAVLQLREDLGEFLMTILFCNMVVNILFFAVSTVVAADMAKTYGPAGAAGFGLLCLLTVITFGEVTPKALAAVARGAFCRLTALPILALHRLLWPVRAILGELVRVLERVGHFQPEKTRMTPDELRLLAEASRGDGVISRDEHTLIGAVLEFPEIRVKEMMTPRVDVVSMPREATAADVIAAARECGRVKFPVRDAETEDYFGWVDARDIFARNGEGEILPFLQRPIFLSELDRAEHAWAVLRSGGDRLAIVVDERGATAGIVTPSDVLAEVFGEMSDVDGEPVEAMRPDGNNAYLLDGGVSIRAWRNLFGEVVDLPDTTTLSGLVVSLLGTPPSVGDVVTLGNLRLEVTAVSRRRATQIRLTLEPQESAPC